MRCSLSRVCTVWCVSLSWSCNRHAQHNAECPGLQVQCIARIKKNIIAWSGGTVGISQHGIHDQRRFDIKYSTKPLFGLWIRPRVILFMEIRHQLRIPRRSWSWFLFPVCATWLPGALVLCCLRILGGGCEKETFKTYMCWSLYSRGNRSECVQFETALSKRHTTCTTKYKNNWKQAEDLSSKKFLVGKKVSHFGNSLVGTDDSAKVSTKFWCWDYQARA